MLDLDLSVPVDYFTKRAKDLRSRVRAGEVEACARVRAVFHDAAERSDQELSDFALMRAQHVVAVEHGFADWKTLLNASSVESRLAITMARHPELNDVGIGLHYGHMSKSDAEKEAINTENRRKLRAKAADVAATVTWLLENVEPTRTINKRHTSYGFKQVAEKDIGYITNGVFIAAGIIAGYPHEIDLNSPNVAFGMSEKSFKAIFDRRTSPERLLRRFVPRAVEILARRGIQAFPVAGANVDVVWRDSGDVRTLRIGTIEKTPFIVRLFVDHFSLMISPRVASALGVAGTTVQIEARPRRPKAEISILLDEVDPALEWALHHDARSNAPPPPPPFDVSGWNKWENLWSKRAADRSAIRRKQITSSAPAPSAGTELPDGAEANP